MNKYLFYNDVFAGLFDQYVDSSADGRYADYSRRLAKFTKDEKFGYIFANVKALCDVMEIKADLGNKVRAAYLAKDKGKLKELSDTAFPLLIKRMETFYETFRAQWMKENKSFGFEVHDMRIGGLIRRITDCRRVLTEYLDGKIDRIEQLEQKRLDYWGGEDKFDRDPTMYQWWYSIITANNV